MPPYSTLSHQTKPFSRFKQRPTKENCLIRTLIDLCHQGKLTEAVNSLPTLAKRGIRLDTKTTSFLLSQCAKAKSLREGKWVHLHLKLTGMTRHQNNTMVFNHLLHMYFECGDHTEARKLFDRMSVRNLYSWNNAVSGYVKLGMISAARRLFDRMGERDVVSWNTMVIGYAQCGDFREAVSLYKEFRREGVGFNAYSFAGVLSVGMKLRDLVLVKQLHCQALVGGVVSNLVLSSSVLDAYAKCGQMGDARRVFDEMSVRDIPAWTSLISGYCLCGDMRSAQEFFDMMPAKNPVSWTALVSGYARNNMGRNALEVFRRMMMLRIRPDQFTFSSCLCACASLPSLKHGKQIHAYMILSGFRPNTIVVSSLIDMYSKCGELKLSRLVFKLMGNKQDVMIWNPMLAALAHHGHGEEATKLFDEMILAGVKPNRVTFVVLLTACSHSGLLDRGLALLNSMSNDHGIPPDEEHYACVVDLLGRAGRFDELMKQLESMPCKDGSRIWNALVGVCHIHGDTQVGKELAERLIQQDPESYAPYILLSSIYAASGNWENVAKTRQLMSQKNLRKEQGSSWVENNNKLQALSA